MDVSSLDPDRFRISPGDAPGLADRPTRADDLLGPDDEDAKATAEALNEELSERIGDLQERLWATKAAKVLVVLQGMDTSGKDSTTRRVFGAGSPLGIAVKGFGRPTEEELAHGYLWRVHRHTPADGEIVIFNRSHYEDVLVVRVDDLVPEGRWRRRYGHIVDFERMLADEGTIILKFMLHISHDEQRERLQERIDNPKKHWKFEHHDLRVRESWGEYMAAYEDAITRTSTEHAPWYVVPSDQKWFRDLVVGRVVVDALERLEMPWPDPEPGIEGLVVE
ncbi:PPK2 family polyphosphate kinase [Actinomarinicola tropica]|uniref:Polyphosphate kinase 2 family protein n=1 Tax=Actinomarinicola tropica TaxID=2789776 RepID=A0A5Q2RN27_9ACTN|nr:PPK2 family polyphosphate kinase [Actinomarinicola tropica]QGG94605.1 polyphosphate kinase 2 family protein [Actinomarinicola tropica]